MGSSLVEGDGESNGALVAVRQGIRVGLDGVALGVHALVASTAEKRIDSRVVALVGETFGVK